MTTPAVRRGLSPTRAVLENGAVVIVQETRTTPAVTITATVQAGGVYEPADRPGVAYLTGRVLDRGTTSRSAGDIAEELDDRGVSLRVATARHTMAVTCTCLAEDFDPLLTMVIDIVRNPAFPEAEFAKRQAECVSALRQDQDNPAVRAAEALFELLYGPAHPYGRRAKGTLESVARITRDDLVAHHLGHVSPQRLSLVVVGDVDAGRVVDRAARAIDGWRSPVDGVEPAMPVTPWLADRREVTIDVPGKSQSDIAYGFVTIRRSDPRYYAYWVMNNVLGQFGLGGRLGDNIRERQGMAYYAYSAIDPSVGEGPLFVRAGVDPADVGRAVAAIDHEVLTLGRDGPTAAELAQSQQYLIGSIPRTLETNAGIASFLATSEQFGLGLDYDCRLPEHLRAVTRDDVAAAAHEVLDPRRAAVAIAGPASA
jgi:zinc protease